MHTNRHVKILMETSAEHYKLIISDFQLAQISTNIVQDVSS